MFRTILIALFFFAAPAVAKPADPRAVVNELLAADLTFSVDAAKAVDPVAGISAMLDKDVIMPSPKGHAIGRDAVVALFRENPSYKEGIVSWSPIRGGISADGTQGFTYGFLTVSAGDPARRDRKYLAYWIKRPEGWRVVAYRQQVRQPGDVSKDLLAPSLPAAGAEPVADLNVIAAHQASLAAAEKSFSDHAQKVGLRTAFRDFGRDDAMNMYGGAGFAIGLDAVVAGFKEEGPATIHWSTERSLAASSGDLGVSIGTIRSNDPAKNEAFAFFTVWRRDGPDKPWRYIAE
jgi:hypothetical protein